MLSLGKFFEFSHRDSMNLVVFKGCEYFKQIISFFRQLDFKSSELHPICLHRGTFVEFSSTPRFVHIRMGDFFITYGVELYS